MQLLLVITALACDSGLDWSEKGGAPGTTAVNRSSWPSAQARMRAVADSLDSAGTWPFGADATSFSATITWHEMKPKNGGSVFVSNFLNEGCGSGYVGAQMHAGTDQMFADWAIWDIGAYSTAFPMSKECVRYDGEGHGTQCGVLPGQTWEMETPYVFNVSIVDTNATGTHFAGFIKNNRSNEVYKLGEIFTKTPPKKAGEFNCARLTVGSSPFQEIYSGGNFENTVSVQGPVFRGVAKHPADVLPTGGTNCYYHHSCYGKDGPANCRNESGIYDGTSPGNPVPITTFTSGKTPVPDAYIPPWDHNPDVAPSSTCTNSENTGLTGGLIPGIWGMVVMNVIWPTKEWMGYCCGYCEADPDCVAAQLYGDQCTLHHNVPGSPPKPIPVKGQGVVVPRKL